MTANPSRTRCTTVTRSSFLMVTIRFPRRPAIVCIIYGEWREKSGAWLCTKILPTAGFTSHENGGARFNIGLCCCGAGARRSFSMGHLCAVVFRNNDQLHRSAGHRHSETDPPGPVPL